MKAQPSISSEQEITCLDKNNNNDPEGLKSLIDNLLSSQFLAQLEKNDPLLEAKLKGVQHKQELLNYQGKKDSYFTSFITLPNSRARIEAAIRGNLDDFAAFV